MVRMDISGSFVSQSVMITEVIMMTRVRWLLLMLPVFIVIISPSLCVADDGYLSYEEAVLLFENLYGISNGFIRLSFQCEIQPFPDAVPEPFYTCIFTYNDDRSYRFTISVALSDNQVISFTNPLLMHQLHLKISVGDYTAIFVERMKERERVWGDSMWWSYVQRYEFQMELFGYGVEGYTHNYALPNADDIQYQDARAIAIESFKNMTGLDFDNSIEIAEECISDIRSYTSLEYCTNRNLQWRFYFTNSDGSYLYSSIVVHSDGTPEAQLHNRDCTLYDIGYMKGIPSFYQTYYLNPEVNAD